MTQPSRRLYAAWFGAGLLTATMLVGCTDDPNSVAAQAKSGDQKGYVSGDGSYQTFAIADRGAPVDFSGTTLTGESWSLADRRGKVVVINVWASWCAACRDEHPLLVALAREVIARFSEAASAGGSPVSLAADHPVIARCDPLRIEQVMSNLLSNAIKYGGGQPIEVAVGAANDSGQLIVRDRGIGIGSTVPASTGGAVVPASDCAVPASTPASIVG